MRTTVEHIVAGLTVIGCAPSMIKSWTRLAVASMPINSNDSTKSIFSRTFAQCTAQMEWQAAVGDFTFNSDPLEASHSKFAEIGQETNGSYLTA